MHRGWPGCKTIRIVQSLRGRQEWRPPAGAPLVTPIHLIRHARPASAWDGGDADHGVDAIGRAQAGDAAKRLPSLARELRPRQIASSPLRPCRETAAALGKLLGKDVVVDDALGEIPPPRALALADRPAGLARALSGSWGEINYAVGRRWVHAAVARHPGAAIFSHFVALNGVVSLLRYLNAVVVFRPDHASITALTWSASGLGLASPGREAATGVL